MLVLISFRLCSPFCYNFVQINHRKQSLYNMHSCSHCSPILVCAKFKVIYYKSNYRKCVLMPKLAILNERLPKYYIGGSGRQVHNEQMCFNITALPVDGVLDADCPWDGTCSHDGSCTGTSQISSIFSVNCSYCNKFLLIIYGYY